MDTFMLIKHNVSLLTVLATLSVSAVAGDWPQILGPNRDGIAVGETLLPTWPDAGPELAWTADVGDGFAGVAVRNNVVFLFQRKKDQEVVTALNAETGQEIWSRGFACRYQSGMSSDTGPRCVPVVTENRVFVFGVEGHLRCLDSTTGDAIWSRDTQEDFSAPEGYFGTGSSPLHFQDRLIVNIGGRDNASIVAFSTKDGSTIWKNFNDTASYSSPVVVNVNGTIHAIVVTRLHVVSLNPKDGTVRFSFPFGARGPTVNGATPVVMGDKLFVSASYRVGSASAEISDSAADHSSSGEKLLATQYATPVKHDGLLFAVDGRQDSGTASLKCIDPSAERVLWVEDGFEYGTLIRVNDELLFLSCGGELIRFAADRTGYRPSHRSRILKSTPRGYRLPAISIGRLFVRDDHQLKCLVVGETD
jgi:outer membrane protein assembly factor BamB